MRTQSLLVSTQLANGCAGAWRLIDGFAVKLPCARALHRSRPVWLWTAPWTAARQAPLSVGFPRPESWGGLPFPPPGDLPDPGSEPASHALQAES